MSTTEKPQRKRQVHPNRVPFEGMLTRLDVPSDIAPAGSRGHRVILTFEAAARALNTLYGMAVSFKKEWDGHDARQKCGVITEAWIEEHELWVGGHLFCKDFPEIALQIADPNMQMGMSYEMTEAHVTDTRSEVWVLTKVTFTGAAILLRDKAAYKTTTFNISAGEEEFTGTLRFEGEGTIQLKD